MYHISPMQMWAPMKTGALFFLVAVLFAALRIVLGQNTLLLYKYVLNKHRKVWRAGKSGGVPHDT